MQLPNDDFSVEDLVCNEYFQQYCLGISLENQILWNEWISIHSERAADLEEAKKIIHILSAKQGSRIQQLKDLRGGMKQHDVLENMLSLQADLNVTEMPDIQGSTLSSVKIFTNKATKHISDNSSDQITSTSETGVLQTRPLKDNNQKLYKYVSIAAAVLVITAGSLWWTKKDNFTIKQSISSTYLSGNSITSGAAPRKTVILADGTLITLGKESTIRLTENFSSGKRELWLSGEAFFDVKHDRAHPFVVHTSFNDIKVLGTTFNVKAYPNSKSMETSLIRGSVRVDSKKYSGYSVTLKPNEKLVTNDSLQPAHNSINVAFKISAIKNENLAQRPEEIKWVRNHMDIENEPLSAIATKLQAWYGITIVIADDNVKNYRYSGVFENETVIKTLEALQLSYPFAFKVEQDKITITK